MGEILPIPAGQHGKAFLATSDALGPYHGEDAMLEKLLQMEVKAEIQKMSATEHLKRYDQSQYPVKVE